MSTTASARHARSRDETRRLQRGGGEYSAPRRDKKRRRPAAVDSSEFDHRREGSAYAYGSCGKVCERGEIGGGKVRKRKERVSQPPSPPVNQPVRQSSRRAARSPSLVRSLTRSLLGVLIS